MLSKDLGTMLVGEDAVKEGLMDEVGGLKEAIDKVHEIYMLSQKKQPEKKLKE
jgi:ClpP class serine protease